MPKKIIQEEKLPVVLPEDTEIYSECIQAVFWIQSAVYTALKCKYTNILSKPCMIKMLTKIKSAECLLAWENLLFFINLKTKLSCAYNIIQL